MRIFFPDKHGRQWVDGKAPDFAFCFFVALASFCLFSLFLWCFKKEEDIDNLQKKIKELEEQLDTAQTQLEETNTKLDDTQKQQNTVSGGLRRRRTNFLHAPFFFQHLPGLRTNQQLLSFTKQKEDEVDKMSRRIKELEDNLDTAQTQLDETKAKLEETEKSQSNVSPLPPSWLALGCSSAPSPLTPCFHPNEPDHRLDPSQPQSARFTPEVPVSARKLPFSPWLLPFYSKRKTSAVFRSEFRLWRVSWTRPRVSWTKPRKNSKSPRRRTPM